MKSQQVDLHLHTTASDGTWLPQELVAAVQLAGLGSFAVTDHETVANVAATQKYAQEAGLNFVPGVEISTTEGQHSFHILGYGIDITNQHLLELLAHNENLLAQKDEDSISKLIKQGWPLSLNTFADYRYDRRRGGWKALNYLQDLGLCVDVRDFFNRIFTADNDLGFPVFPTMNETIQTIRQAGGVALLAHAASDFHGPGLDATLLQLASQPLDGFECYHSGHSQEDTATLVRYCHERGLLISGGSDCHGTFVPGRHLGEPLIFLEDLVLPGLL
ncbi:MAG: PHP domain-containing protein [Acidaminococcaceae bacterium]